MVMVRVLTHAPRRHSQQETGKKFWSTKDKGQQPFEYSAGVGGVITGWDQGCLGMKLGEVRKLSIPADEGYGANGFPAWGIPPNGGLDFGACLPCSVETMHAFTHAPPSAAQKSRCLRSSDVQLEN